MKLKLMKKKKKKKKKKMGREDERGRVPESYLEWIYLRVRCSPGATPSWEPHFGRAGQGARNGPSEDELIGSSRRR